MTNDGFRLPDMWVYVRYADGTKENVANTDDLTLKEAMQFRDQWERVRGKKVIRVTLETGLGAIYKHYEF